MVNQLSGEEFLDKKRDYSPLLVHLTKDDRYDESIISAKDVLDTILSEKTLKAFNHFCLFSPNLEESQDVSLEDEFKVILTSFEILIMDMRYNLERSESALNKYREKVE